MSTEITTTGSKKIKTLRKEFNKKFPYLNLWLHPSSGKKAIEKGDGLAGLDMNKTLSEVREKKGSGTISIHGRKKVKTLEAEFEEIFGLYAQVCWENSEGRRYYTTGGDNDKSLSALNREKQAAGAQKGAWV